VLSPKCKRQARQPSTGGMEWESLADGRGGEGFNLMGSLEGGLKNRKIRGTAPRELESHILGVIPVWDHKGKVRKASFPSSAQRKGGEEKGERGRYQPSRGRPQNLWV